MRELAAQGLAREESAPSGTGKSMITYFRVSDEGYKMIADAMQRNGERAKQWNDEHRGVIEPSTRVAAYSPAGPTSTSTPSAASPT